jgi:PleD family two-component response regulator
VAISHTVCEDCDKEVRKLLEVEIPKKKARISENEIDECVRFADLAKPVSMEPAYSDMKVLVVDDSKLQREMIKNILKNTSKWFPSWS